MLKQEFFLFLVEYVWVCFVGGALVKSISSSSCFELVASGEEPK